MTRIIAETKYLRLVDRDGWTYVERPNISGVVGIVAVTDQRKIVLVEQYRPPVDARVIALPAGLAGDIDDEENESLATAAKRELLEETGYQADTLTDLAEVTTSAGLTNETMHLFWAEGLEKIESGGGDGNENISVFEVSLDEVDGWLAQQRAEGKFVDAKVYAGLYWAFRSVRT